MTCHSYSEVGVLGDGADVLHKIHAMLKARICRNPSLIASGCVCVDLFTTGSVYEFVNDSPPRSASRLLIPRSLAACKDG